MTYARCALALSGIAAFGALFFYPMFYVVFPWTVPITYLLAMVASLMVTLLAVCR